MNWWWLAGVLLLGLIAEYTWYRYIFGEKPTPGPWICPDCLTGNDQAAASCSLCEKPRPERRRLDAG